MATVPCLWFPFLRRAPTCRGQAHLPPRVGKCLWPGRSGQHSWGINGFPVVGEAPSKTLVETAKEATEKAKETALAATEKAKDLASKAATKKKQYV